MVALWAVVAAAAAPVVTNSSPSRQVLLLGQSLNLSFTASGSGALTYQWSHNGRSIAGATASNFSIPTTAYPDSGYYLVDVSDPTGTQRSLAMFVGVGPAVSQVIPGDTFPSSLTDVIAVATGGRSYYNHYLAIRRDGSVFAWGNNEFGQATVPAGLSSVVAVAAGDSHSLALKSDGTVVAWGGNEYESARVPADLTDVIAIAVGGKQSYAIKRDGTLVRWVYSGFTSYVPPDLTDVVSVVATQDHALALKSDGTIVTWGVNSFGIISVPAGLTDVVAIAGDDTISMALKKNGTVVAWGSGAVGLSSNLTDIVAIAADGVLLKSDGTLVDFSGAPYPGGYTNVLSLSGGFLRDTASDTLPSVTTQPVSQNKLETESVTLTVNASGAGPLYYQWRKDGVDIAGATTATLSFPALLATDSGSYSVGVTNHIESTLSSVATLLVTPLPAIFSQSSARQVLLPGESRTLSVSATGTGPLSYQWTWNNRPIPGATNPTLSLPAVTLRDSGAYMVHLTDNNGTRHSAAMFVTVAPAVTQVRAWGNNTTGQTTVPTGLNDAIAIAPNPRGYVTALKRDGTLTVWGTIPQQSGLFIAPWIPGSDMVAIASGASSLALGSNGIVTTWISIISDSWPWERVNTKGVVAIAAGGDFALALKSDGAVEHNSGRPLPSGLTNVVAIAASRAQSYALKADGTVVTWLSSYYDFNVPSTIEPVPTGLSNVMAIAAGGAFAMALKTDGTVVAWGDNTHGQTNFPSGLSNVIAISTSGDHCLALKSDGTVVAWGKNDNSQVTPPANLANVFSIAAGNNTSFALRDASLEGPPVIAVQPVSQTQVKAHPVTFSATAGGAGPISYQWKKNGVALPGAINSSYSIAKVSAGDAGSYTLMVTNVLGMATSMAATLTVTNNSLDDFSGDGQSDILFQNAATGELRLWLMNETTKDSELALSTVSTAWQIVGTADFNRDGQTDILWQNTATGERLAWLLNGTTIVSYLPIGTVDLVWNIGVVADFNRDGHPDLLWENTLTGERGLWLMTDGNLTGYVALGTLGIQWSAAGTGDYNGDDSTDIVWQNALTGERKVWLMYDTVKSSEVSLGFVALEWSIGSVADYNGDGQPDIFWQNKTTGEHAIWLMNGTTVTDFAFPPTDSTNWVVGRIPRRPAAADFNLDGSSDLVWQNTTTGERKIWLMNGTAFSSEVSLVAVSTDWQIACIGDLDNDGHWDLIRQNTVTGERGVWLMNDTTITSFVSLGVVGLNWQIVGTGDFNADNRTDILWQNTVTGERGIWLMFGTTLSGWAGLGTVSTNWQIAGVADFNRDDQPDILWQNTATGERKVWYMNGTAFGSEASLGVVGLAWKIVGAADYNGDGSVDILWQNTVTGEGGIWLLNGLALSGYVPLATQPLVWQIAN